MWDPRQSDVPLLSSRQAERPRTALAHWLRGEDADAPAHAPDAHTHPWYQVLWLTGVDYFSTLGYQPGIALLAAGAIAPIATGILVLVTLFGALPVYAAVAKRSYAGQGSIAMIENLLSGWRGTVVVLVLIGFAATDFVITMTLSAADAAQHAIENPLLHDLIGEHRMGLTIGLLLLLSAVFLKGFAEAIGIAALVAVPYILLNLVVLGHGIWTLVTHPHYLAQWTGALGHTGSTMHLVLAGLLVFPKLALGMSGFETGVSVMPLVRGSPDDAAHGVPAGRIANTRRMLVAAAAIMSVLLLLSSVVTATLVPESAYHEGGSAAGRALAWLAHEHLGHAFGSVYDAFTIAILWFAGASAMAGLLALIPRYLPRLGMAPNWVAHRRPLVLVLTVIAVIVTVIFKADVEAQGGAYATGVLVLMQSAAIAVAISLWREARADPETARRTRLASGYFWVVAAVFTYTLVDNVIVRPDGVFIASGFILLVVFVGALSRTRRATELRVAHVRLSDDESLALWQEIVGKKVNLVPLKHSDPDGRVRKGHELRRHYRVDGPLAFIHVTLLDNRSEFLAPLSLTVRRVGKHDYAIEVTGAIAIANTVAYVSELIDPISIFLGLTLRDPMTQSLRFVLWGEGETGLMVYKILQRYWEWTPEDDMRPYIFLMSE